jgi:hypothetical protein
VNLKNMLGEIDADRGDTRQIADYPAHVDGAPGWTSTITPWRLGIAESNPLTSSQFLPPVWMRVFR